MPRIRAYGFGAGRIEIDRRVETAGESLFRALESGPRDCWYDVAEFEQQLEWAAALAPNEPGRARRCLETAVSLYQGDFLEGEAGEWAAERRVELRARYVDALVALGERLFREGYYPEAASAFREAARKDSNSQAAARGLALCAVRQGERRVALALLDGIAAPDEATRALAARIRAGENL